MLYFKNILIILFVFFVSIFIFPEESTNNYKNNCTDYSYLSVGMSFTGGGRYDNVRMCVASMKDVPGGIAFEFLGFVLEYRVNKNFGIGLYLPIGRPLLFGAGFGMLQFLPEYNMIFHFPFHRIIDFIIIWGIGASLHYGPGYESDRVNKDPSFFAAGPRSSLLAGIMIYFKFFSLTIGAKPYVEYLANGNRQGLVGGGEIDFQFKFKVTGNQKL